ncbi:MAG: Leucine--tRNA ligase [Firmicutes bacterium ADurb.Bin467]|nr:MAG: Leucine--tRNA ligase [Firmicutes bacterium ADurb.Bin467]
MLFPIGYDAFGLPTENYAIKNRIHPAVVTEKNVQRFRTQLKRLGFSFDYDREVSTTDPKYYKWTQWIFLKLYEAGLAYKMEMPINWCTSCKVGLANEEVVGGVCERCGGEVVRKVKSQWMLRITDYAQKLLDGLDELDFIEKVKVQQRNWIGRSEGAEVDFALTTGDTLRVFTTRPDTLFGATYMVMSPEHPLIERHRGQIRNFEEIALYRELAAHKSDFERTELNKEKTGVEIDGMRAVNPATGREIPIWVSDYVLMGYGTGAIMAVPAHDERDWEFAKKFGLPIVEVVAGGNVDEAAYTDIAEGMMVNSGLLNGLKVKDAIQTITDWLVEKGLGERKVNYKLRDWVFSRQRYWGEPIPLVCCEHCGWVPLPYEQLPLTLPEVESYMPTDSGESPLAAIDSWVNTACPKCGGPARRETDTMPQWAGSSWYFLRYIDPFNDTELASMDEMKYWLPIDWYNGGMEHTTLHLLYSRFWHRFLYDIGVVPTKEPYQKRTSHGMILGADGEKMSKSRGNVVNPDLIVDELGADAFRTYEMFMGAFDQAIPWSTEGARGCRRFLDRVWRLMEMLNSAEGVSKDMAYDVNFAIRKVTEDFERMKFNTAIAQMMSLVNAFYAKGSITRTELRTLLHLLNPVAPHITEEINKLCELGEELFRAPWPACDEAALVRETVEIAVQVNGKVRGRLDVPADLAREGAEAYFRSVPEVRRLVGDKPIHKLVFVPGRLVNIVC